MRYLLIDRITEWEAGKKIKGIKNVAMSEDFLEFHFPRNPIMPGVMLLEALAQLAGWLNAASSDFTTWFLITGVSTCKFYSFALPGDSVQLEVRALPGSLPEKMMYSGVGMVDGRKKVTVEFAGQTVPVDEIEDAEEQKRFFKLLTRELSIR